MKKHEKEKHHKAGGGSMEKKPQETPESGAREWEEDEKDKPEARTNAKKIDDEAEERKAGGKVAKNVGGVTGSAPSASAARAPRKSGGRTGSDGNPFSSARAGTPPKGHKTTDVD